MPSLRQAAEAAKHRLGLRKLSETGPADQLPTLREFIPRVSRGFTPPLHLLPALERLESFQAAPCRFVFTVPPRHGKTELVLHWIAWALRICPWLNVAYVTYNGDQAKTMSRRCMALATAAGVRLTKHAEQEWATDQNSYCIFTGIDGPLTGKGFHIIVIDDAYKNRAAAESRTVRNQVEEAWRSDIRSRLFPGGSVVEVQTRWHEEDLAGYLVAGGNSEAKFTPFELVKLQAISNEGTEHERALWPEVWTLEFLKQTRDEVGQYAWVSLYQGEPRPRGAKVFRDAWYYQTLPPAARAAIGVDLAYTDATRADHSVALALVRGKDGLTYVAEERRFQMEAPQFKVVLRAMRSRFPGARVRWYCSGVEKGVADFIRAVPDPVPLEAVVVTTDKFIRATPAAAAWNRGDILVPQGAPWAEAFLAEINGFTGKGDKEDDRVDALAAGFDLLEDPRSSKVTNEPGGRIDPRRV